MTSRNVLAFVTTATLSLSVACAGAVDEGAPEMSGTTVGPDGKVIPKTPSGAGGTGVVAPDPGMGGSTAMPKPPVAAGTGAAGLRPIARLTKAQYRNTIRDLKLVSDADVVTQDLPGDTKAGFGYEVAGDISNLEVDRYFSVAGDIARRATEGSRLKTTVVCDPATGEVCARDFVTKFGRKAYRRPLEAEEVTELMAFFTKARTELKYDFANSIRMVLQAMLQSPSFLYRWELGSAKPEAQGGLVKLNNFEMAARLSYFLWGSLPDDALAAAADASKLGTAAEISAQADRMLLATDKMKDTLGRFHEQWLEIESLATAQKDPKLVMNFATLAMSMAKENARFVEHVFLEDGGKLETLLGAPYSFVDGPISQLYGIPGVMGAALTKTPLPANQRLGILTQGAFLAAHAPPDKTSPVRRGKTLLEKFLCTPPPPPPDGVEIMPPMPKAGAQTRELFAMHAEGACRGCHVVMDNLGFAFEAYDAAGRYRATEEGRPVNTKVTVPGIDGKDRDFADALELSKTLSTSDQVRACLVTQWARFGLGRLEVAEEKASLDEAFAEFKAGGFDIRRVLVGLVKSKTFMYRTPYTWEVK